METQIQELIEQWMNGNRKHVIQTLMDEHPSRSYLAAVIAVRLNRDQWRTFLDMLMDAIPEEKKYKVSVDHDPLTPNPCTDGDGRWQIYTTNSKEFLTLLDTDTDSEYAAFNAETLAKLQDGLAFVLSYSEHGPQCQWALKNTGPIHNFDPNEGDGIVVWEEDEDNLGPTTYLDRENDCSREVNEYSNWCNGNCYQYKVTSQGKEIDTDRGVIGDYIEQAISDSLPDDATKDNTEIIDPIGVLAYCDVFNKKETHAQD